MLVTVVPSAAGGMKELKELTTLVHRSWRSVRELACCCCEVSWVIVAEAEVTVGSWVMYCTGLGEASDLDNPLWEVNRASSQAGRAANHS
jgi:hypothetical protein